MVVQDIKDINIPKPDKDGYCKAFKVIYSREIPHYTEYAKEYCNFFKDNCSLFDYSFVYQVGINIAKHSNSPRIIFVKGDFKIFCFVVDCMIE